MTFIDAILNFAGLLLWVSWRSLSFDPLVKQKPPALVSTVKRTESRFLSRWHFLAALVALLALRGLVYWQIGSAVDWVPSLKLGAISISFRSDVPGRILLFFGSELRFDVDRILFVAVAVVACERTRGGWRSSAKDDPSAPWNRGSLAPGCETTFARVRLGGNLACGASLSGAIGPHRRVVIGEARAGTGSVDWTGRLPRLEISNRSGAAFVVVSDVCLPGRPCSLEFRAAYRAQPAFAPALAAFASWPSGFGSVA